MLALRRASLLVAFYLLTSAATAHAECAWVLWNATNFLSGNTEREWRMMGAFPTHGACQASFGLTVDTYLAKMRSAENTVTIHGDEIVVSGESLQPIMQRFVCLPDTVDPRGPKGGGR